MTFNLIKRLDYMRAETVLRKICGLGSFILKKSIVRHATHQRVCERPHAKWLLQLSAYVDVICRCQLCHETFWSVLYKLSVQRRPSSSMLLFNMTSVKWSELENKVFRMH